MATNNPSCSTWRTIPTNGEILQAMPACADVREDLLRRVLEGWDGQFIQQQVQQHRQDYKALACYNRLVQPATPSHWKPPANLDEFDGAPPA